MTAASAFGGLRAHAQTGGGGSATLPAPAVELHGYHGSPFADRFLRLDAPGVLPAWRFRVGVEADYADRPLVVTLASPSITAPGQSSMALVRHAVGANLAASVGIAGRLELGAMLPVTVFQAGTTPAGVEPPASLGIEAARLGVKLRIIGHGSGGPPGGSGAGGWGPRADGFALGASVVAAIPIPTLGAGGLVRESGLGGEARLHASWQRGPLALGLGAGYRLRQATRLYDVPLGNELGGAAAAELRVGLRTALLAELAGATAAQRPFASAKQSPLEALVGVRRRVGAFTLFAAGGPGLIDGYGAPLVRAVAGLSWSNAAPDADGDGIPDDADRCPYDPEDRDGFEDGDGCPDPDNDKDGFLDAADKCPNAPETKNGFEDGDGCRDDKPAPPEAKKDRDGDSIADADDKCPDDPEDADGFEDEDGCPDPDNDKDGIADASDKCPTEPETINNVADDDGCADKGGTVRLRDNELETLTPILFKTDRARVRHAFHRSLRDIAAILVAHPEIGRCAVEGHTDGTGPTDWNQELSQRRARSVVKYLVGRGVDPERLVSLGHGEELPWASNSTEEGRAANRRVLFHIEGVGAEQQRLQVDIQRRNAARRTGAALDVGARAPATATPAPSAAAGVPRAQQ